MVAKMPTPISPTHKLHRVLDYLQLHGSATKKDIRENCFYMNAGDAIFSLRDKGHLIDTIMQKTESGSTYALYVYRGVKK